MTAFRVLLALATLLPACSDNWLTGKWRGELTATPEGKVFLTLEQDYENVFGSGRYEDSTQNMDISVQGSVKDEEIELEIFLDPEARYEAHSQGENMMTGTWFHRGTSEKLTLERL